MKSKAEHFKESVRKIISATKSAVDAAEAREKLAKRKASKKIQAGKSA